MKHWDAFCTMFWYATGYKIVADAPDSVVAPLYHWYINSIEFRRGQ